jgi:hypothetical protein
VSARYTKQPDGSFRRTETQYITVETSKLAAWLLSVFRPTERETGEVE